MTHLFVPAVPGTVVILLLLSYIASVGGFVGVGYRAVHTVHNHGIRSKQHPLRVGKVNPDELFDRQRQEELFQFLLRDLQIENVPLLSVDADQVHTMQAAIWTIMADMLVTTKESEKSCLIFEDIPISALRSFVTAFRTMQTDPYIQQQLPEMCYFHLSLVGNGMGPAMLIEVSMPTTGASTTDTAATESGTESFQEQPSPTNDASVLKATRMFVERMVSVTEMGIQPVSTVGYRICHHHCTDLCHVMSSFWNAICELQGTSSEQMSSLFLLLLPPPTLDWDRFLAITNVVSQFLCLYRGEATYELLYCHPQYRLYHPNNRIMESQPQMDQPMFGHLPPALWIEPMIQYYKDTKNDNSSSSSSGSIQQLDLVKYLRRSPIPCIGIARVARIEQEQLEAQRRRGDDDNGVASINSDLPGVVLDVGDGKNVVMDRSTIVWLGQCIRQLQEMDQNLPSLEQQHEDEMMMTVATTATTTATDATTIP
jgi:hypothetical protein